jgi:general secretion pathway protein D
VVNRLTRILLAFLVLALAPTISGAAGEKPQPRKKPARESGECKKLPDKATVKLNLKPDTEVADVIAWYATISCTPMFVSSGVSLAGKKVTVLSPTPVTMAELRRLFFAALDSVGLAVEPNGKFLRIIDAARAKSSAIPVEKDRR